MDFPFAHRQRVRFGETDLQGVVYYANYLLFAEIGRIAYLRELGIVYDRDMVARGVDFTIGEARVRYQAPLRFDDEYDIKVRVGEIRHSSAVRPSSRTTSCICVISSALVYSGRNRPAASASSTVRFRNA